MKLESIKTQNTFEFINVAHVTSIEYRLALSKFFFQIIYRLLIRRRAQIEKSNALKITSIILTFNIY